MMCVYIPKIIGIVLKFDHLKKNYQLEFSGIWTKSQKSTKSDVICKHLSKNRRIPVTYYALEFSGIWTKTLRARLFCCPKPEEFQLYIRNWNFTGFGQKSEKGVEYQESGFQNLKFSDKLEYCFCLSM